MAHQDQDATDAPAIILPPPPRPRRIATHKPPPKIKPAGQHAQGLIARAIAARLAERREAFARLPIAWGTRRRAVALEIKALAALAKTPGRGFDAEGIAPGTPQEQRAALAMALAKSLANARRLTSLSATMATRRANMTRQNRLEQLQAMALASLDDAGRHALANQADQGG